MKRIAGSQGGLWQRPVGRGDSPQWLEQGWKAECKAQTPEKMAQIPCHVHQLANPIVLPFLGTAASLAASTFHYRRQGFPIVPNLQYSL